MSIPAQRIDTGSRSALSAANSTAAASANAYTAIVAAGSPLAYFKLNDLGSTMVDSGANRLNGIYGSGVRHGAQALTSAGDVASIFPLTASGAPIADNTGTVTANAAFAVPTTGLTVEAWIKPADYNRTNHYVSLVSYGRGVIGNAWTLQLTPQSGLTFNLKVNGGGYLLAQTSKILPGQIYHVVATYNGSELALYVNGQLATSALAHGTINYNGISSGYGLSIGGSLGSSLPIFNGAINDVALYPSALSAASVENHYFVGEISTPVTVVPTTSDTFVDSIGVVTHLRSSGTPYTNILFPSVEAMMKASGIRHIGDTLITSPLSYVAKINALGADGIHASLITNLGQTSAQVLSSVAAFKGSIEAVEGPNEPDISGDPNWVADTRTFQQVLWSTIKANPLTAYLPVVGPSMVTAQDAETLGNLSGAMDSGSIHDYFDGYNPGTPGWGNLGSYGIYGSIQFNLGVGSVVSGARGVFSTETGYSSVPTDNEGIDSRTLARYTPRIFLEHFLNGIRRTTLYELYDEPGTGRFANFGLIASNNVPKSSYYAIQSLIAALQDPGGRYWSPKALTYVLTGNVNNVHHLLLQKRNGAYQLVIWVEASGYDQASKTDLTVPLQTVTVKPSLPGPTGTIGVIGDNGMLTTKTLDFSNGAASFPIDDHVSIVSFK